MTEPGDAEVFLVVEYQVDARQVPRKGPPTPISVVVGEGAAERAIRSGMEAHERTVYHALQIAPPETFPIHFVTRN